MYVIYSVKCIMYVQVLCARAALSCFQIARVIYVLWARAANKLFSDCLDYMLQCMYFGLERL